MAIINMCVPCYGKVDQWVVGILGTYETCANKTRNNTHGTILRYRSLKFQVQKYCQKVKFEVLVFL